MISPIRWQALWVRWLMLASFLVVLFGLTFIFFPGPTRRLFDLVLFASVEERSRLPSGMESLLSFIYGVLGAVLVGWGVLLICTVRRLSRTGEHSAWWSILVSLVCWFVPDTGLSLWFGFWRNAVLNCAIALFFVIPLVATVKAYSERRI